MCDNAPVWGTKRILGHNASYLSVLCTLRLLTWCVLNSILFVSPLPSTSFIFSSLFMIQCKLIHVDSALKRRRVAGEPVWVCVCASWCECGISSENHGGAICFRCQRLPTVYSLCYCYLRNAIIVNGCLRLPWHFAQRMFVQWNQPVHCLSCTGLLGGGMRGTIQAGIRQEVGYTLNRSPVRCRADI